ncbi:MAG: carboxymuconolactone decarboxylase family protein [Gammaproteobacteria bacterium]
MSIDHIKARIPEYAKDLRLNFGSVLTTQGAPGLSQDQIWGVALASALASRNESFAADLGELLTEYADVSVIRAAKTAAAVMGMNNIYYRFVHLSGDETYAGMPARLRMNAIASPGVPKIDFELFSIAVSAVNGCGKCIEAHEKALRREGVSPESIHSAVRIAAVIHAIAATGLENAEAA